MKSTLKMFALIALIIPALVLTGCDSDDALAPVVVLEAPVLDTAPPTIPTGLAAATANNNVKVTWDANVVDEDFHGFMVYRIVWGNHYPMLDLPIQENLWVDDHPVNVACTYVVTAMDKVGNESAWAAVNYFGQEDEPRFRMD